MMPQKCFLKKKTWQKFIAATATASGLYFPMYTTCEAGAAAASVTVYIFTIFLLNLYTFFFHLGYRAGP
jgi:hypothetical protein